MLFRMFTREERLTAHCCPNSHPAHKCLGGRLAEKAPQLGFLPAILPSSLDLHLGVTDVLSCSLRCLFIERPCLPILPAPAAQWPHFGISSQPGKRGVSPSSREKSATCCTPTAARSPCWLWEDWSFTPHTSTLKAVRYHHAFVTPRLALATLVLPDPASALAVARQGRRAGHSGLVGEACSPLPGL